MLAATTILASCGTDSKHFKIDGHLLNINQGEFYVYSLQGDGAKALDTIKVQAGRFTYTAECTSPKTLMIVFPNFTEQPVFAQPGKSVDIKGDATHLKEMTVKGTKDNELMNSFREQIHSASPPEAIKYARQFVEDNPTSAVSPYLVRRFFIACDKPDLRTAANLLTRIAAAQPDNMWVKSLQARIQGKTVLGVGTTLPQFRTSDINGSIVSSTDLAATPTAVVIAWATWSYESINMLRIASERQKEQSGKLKVLGICLDPSTATCRQTLKQNNISVQCVCDERMVDGSLFNKFGMKGIPDNVVIRNGHIQAIALSANDLAKEISRQ